MKLSYRRALAVAAATAVAAGLSSGASSAPKRSSGGGKLYVPSNIIKGAALTTGRSFYSSRVKEDSLAGIRLGREAKEILAKWGNPSRITVGSAQAEGAPSGAPTIPGLPSTIPYVPSPYETPRSPSSYPGPLGPGESPFPSLAPPGTVPMMPSITPTPSGGTTPILTQEEVTWTYDLQNGITLEFIITDGIITQITAGGVGPWRLSKTRTGLQLGDTYKLVLWVCGYPESQEYAGRFLRARYINRNRALFTFLRNKLVGITIALVSQELQQ